MITPHDIQTLFGNNLRLIRHKTNLSQMGLSQKTGKSHTFINNMENGKKWVSPETLSVLCNALNVPAYEFFLTDDIRKENSAITIKSKHTQLLENIREMVARYGEEPE